MEKIAIINVFNFDVFPFINYELSEQDLYDGHDLKKRKDLALALCSLPSADTFLMRVE